MLYELILKIKLIRLIFWIIKNLYVLILSFVVFRLKKIRLWFLIDDKFWSCGIDDGCGIFLIVLFGLLILILDI